MALSLLGATVRILSFFADHLLGNLHFAIAAK
ncbi:hypothetical protein BBR47_20790 [Brevibacillus brevis NBRC 100599]|uniref:Uncharacterized protein n=1 Tax=Brevibacillus brevis (strain 47 / JCM 6285 / NBRC 100599) TaxID=358681 RepID=C0ZB97_BREBN|nr:hypothetical protein BBR47_20790 [Brevibacillus brevis NBRC 100599]